MLANREYLELEEILEIEGITKNDLFDLFRRDQINLYLWCSEHHLIGQIKYQGIDKPFTCGIFSYSGVVKPYKKHIEQLINGAKEVNIEKFIIIELDQITNWNPTKPPLISYPNKQFENHKELESPPNFPFFAFIDGEDFETKNQNLVNLYGLLAKYAGKHANHDYGKTFHESIKNKVSITSKNFMSTDIRFSKTEVMELLTPNPTRFLNIKEELGKTKTPNPLDELIIKIAISNPGRSDHIWNLLRVESKKEILDREYDEDGILEEVSLTHLYWRNPRTQTKKPLERGSFKTKYWKLKKKYEF